jgi:tetratricopeptide (TPR) repeat protein
LATNLIGYGFLLARLGKNDEAIVEYTQARDIMKSLCAEHPEMLEYQQLLSMVLGNLGNVLLGQGKSDDAIRSFEEVVAVLESLKKSIGESPEFEDALAMALNNLGASYTNVSRFEDAAKTLESAIEIRKQLLLTLKDNADIHNGLAGSYVNLAEVKIRQDKFAEARSILEEGRPHHDQAIAFNDKNMEYRVFLKNNLKLLGMTVAELGDKEAMTRTSDELVANGMVLNASVNWMTLANKEEATEKKEELLAKIVSLLRTAIDSGAITAQQIEATEELAMLKDRILESKK